MTITYDPGFRCAIQATINRGFNHPLICSMMRLEAESWFKYPMMFYIRYLCAIFYDTIIVAALFFVVTALLLIIRQGQVITSGTTWYQITLLVIFYLYYFFSYRFGGQTIGLRAWKIKLISERNPITPLQVAWRMFIILPAFILSILRIKSSSSLVHTLTKTKMIDLQLTQQ